MDRKNLPPGPYEGIIVRDAATGEILSVEMLADDSALPPDPPTEDWLKRNARLLDTIRPVTEIAALAGSPVLRAAVVGAWLVVDAARLAADPEMPRGRKGLRAAALSLAGLGLAAGLRGAPAALASKARLIGAARQALMVAEQVLRARAAR